VRGWRQSVVLLVEDDPDHAELVSRALVEYGDRVHLVHLADGDTALAYLERRGEWADPARSPRPDLLLLDLRLPGISGREVLEHIRLEPSLCEIPTVILSTSESREDLAVAAGGAADACAVKPIDGARFRDLVQQIVTSWTEVSA
jgi:CheY-like chemotaxis protein